MTGHKLKYVRFYGREVPVVLQNENGPCPMLAIANVLLLRDAIHLPAHSYEIEQEKLMAVLAEYLLDHNPVEPSSQYAANLQQNLQDVISNMHKLTTGVDVNPKFSSVRGFEFTNETAIFDLFNISLVHGWMMDPEEKVASSVGEMSYNQVVAKLISTLGAKAWSSVHTNDDQEASLIDLETVVEVQPAAPYPPLKCHFIASEKGVHLKIEVPEEEPVAEALCNQEVHGTLNPIEVREWETVRDWLESHSNQLSMFGLIQLHQQLPEKELAVFFRNNHFSTIFKENKALYILVTDQGYLSESRLVWEKLESVNNDNQFFTGDFTVFERSSPKNQPESDQDLARAIAASMSNQHNEQAPAPASTDVLPENFLLLNSQPDPIPSHHDADLALALQLQEEENVNQARAQAQAQQQSPYAYNPRVPWGGRDRPDGYNPMAGHQGVPPAGQRVFPPSPGYGSVAPGGRCQQPPSMSPEAGTMPVSSDGEHAAPETLWRKFRRFMKLS